MKRKTAHNFGFGQFAPPVGRTADDGAFFISNVFFIFVKKALMGLTTAVGKHFSKLAKPVIVSHNF